MADLAKAHGFFSCLRGTKTYFGKLRWPKGTQTHWKPGCKSDMLVIFFNFCHSFMTSINLHAALFMLDNELQRPIYTLVPINITLHVWRLKFKITLQLTPKIYLNKIFGNRPNYINFNCAISTKQTFSKTMTQIESNITSFETNCLRF